MGPAELLFKIIMLVTVPVALAGGKPVGAPPTTQNTAPHVPTAFTLAYPFAESSVWEDSNNITESVVLTHAERDWHFAVSGNSFVPGARDSWFIYGLHGYQAVSQTIDGPTYPQWAGQHHGVDFVARGGLAVRAAEEGTVIFAGRLYGRTIIIQHQDGFQTIYGYLGDYGVTTGTHVHPGDQIGTVPGAADTASVIHFAVEQERDDDAVWAVNPTRFWDLSEALIPRSGYNSFYHGPVAPELQLDFTWDRDRYFKLR